MTSIEAHAMSVTSIRREGYVVDPVADLRPVRPNCHSVIHTHSSPFNIDEMKKLRRTYRQA
ncbi:MAG: hypothetical protein WCA06_04450 [Terrimicrobiaceae bacterium]